METRILSALRQRAPVVADPLLKATALLYLRDALENERYEECAEFVQSARDYGASGREISEILRAGARSRVRPREARGL